jgi:hypothetical protein
MVVQDEKIFSVSNLEKIYGGISMKFTIRTPKDDMKPVGAL